MKDFHRPTHGFLAAAPTGSTVTCECGWSCWEAARSESVAAGVVERFEDRLEAARTVRRLRRKAADDGVAAACALYMLRFREHRYRGRYPLYSGMLKPSQFGGQGYPAPGEKIDIWERWTAQGR
jgi:hypothetical protein